MPETGTVGTIYTIEMAIQSSNKTRVIFSRWNSKFSNFSEFVEEFGPDIYLGDLEPAGHHNIWFEDPETREQESVGIFIPENESINEVILALEQEFDAKVEFHSQENMPKVYLMLCIEHSYEIANEDMGPHRILICGCDDEDSNDEENDKFNTVIGPVNKNVEYFQCKCGQDEIALISLN